MLGLRLASAAVQAACHFDEPEQPGQYPLPAFMTVWNAGPEPTLFTVYTFHGHRRQAGSANIRTEGAHPLAISLASYQTGAESGAARAVTNAVGWQARAGVYATSRAEGS
jgi:hypothetical protein